MTAQRRRTRRSRLFGLDIETAPPADLLRRILGFAERGEHRRVSLRERARAEPVVRPTTRCARALQRSDLVYCDGYGVRLATKAIGLPVPHRMTGADWIWGVAALCEARGPLALPARLRRRRVRRRPPRRSSAGTRASTCAARTTATSRSARPHSERVVEHIAEHKPDVLLVGMGTPLQELWVDHYFDRLDAHVVWTVGALFDYVSGRVPRAPHWMADHGLEWIFRLAIEPRRMWRRYLLGNPVFLWRVMNERQDRRAERPPSRPRPFEPAQRAVRARAHAPRGSTRRAPCTRARAAPREPRAGAAGMTGEPRRRARCRLGARGAGGRRWLGCAARSRRCGRARRRRGRCVGRAGRRARRRSRPSPSSRVCGYAPARAAHARRARSRGGRCSCCRSAPSRPGWR